MHVGIRYKLHVLFKHSIKSNMIEIELSDRVLRAEECVWGMGK